MQAARVRASRCYYVAHSLLTSQKSLEAFALFGRAAGRAQVGGLGDFIMAVGAIK
jgi:hypothetical protein